jgi:hypothetical protein
MSRAKDYVCVQCDGPKCFKRVETCKTKLADARTYVGTNLGWIVRRFNGMMIDLCPDCAKKP